MNSVVFVIIGKNEIQENTLVQCYGQKECSTSFEIKEGMLPISHIYSYDFRGQGNVQMTSIEIEFNGLTENFVSSIILMKGKEIIDRFFSLKLTSNNQNWNREKMQHLK